MDNKEYFIPSTPFLEREKAWSESKREKLLIKQ
jgi:hypothetical protein